MEMSILELLAGLDKVEIGEGPEGEVPEGATVIGILPERLQRLLTMRRNFLGQLLAMARELEQRDAPSDEERQKLRWGNMIADKLGEIFWLEVEVTFDLSHSETEIGIMKGWQVWTKEECNCLFCLLRRSIQQDVGILVVDIMPPPLGPSRN